MSKPLVSILIPTSNRLILLKEAVRSVLAQTSTDYEVIITDNCSTDGTQEWVKNIAKKNKKFRHIFHKENIGMVDNWNSGVLEAKGKYIAYLMDDDLWKKDYLSEMIFNLANNKSAAIAVCEVVPFGESSENYPARFYRLNDKGILLNGYSCIRQYLVSRWLVGLPSAVVVRKEALQKYPRLRLITENIRKNPKINYLEVQVQV